MGMKAVYERVDDKNCAGIQYGFYTVSEKYEPLHWHNELEILYYLNGKASILIDGERYQLPKKQAVVINSGQMHNTFYGEGEAMYLCIHIDLMQMEQYVPDLRMYRIDCHPERISEKDFPRYRRLCILLERITKMYIQGEEMLLLKVTGLVYQIFAMLLQDFSRKIPLESSGKDMLSRKRMNEIIAYTEEHCMEQIALEDIAALLGLGKEYFCRWFKKNTGMSYGRYVNEIRLSKIHYDLLHTDEPVSVLMEKHGFMNSKLFYDMFRGIYGCRPLQIRNDSQL